MTAAVKCLRCKIGSQCCKVLHFDTSRAEGFRMDFLCRVHAGESAPLPSPLPFQTDEGRKAELKVGTLRQGERTRTHQKRKGVFSEAPQRRVGGSVRAVRWLIESVVKWSLLSLISFIRMKSYLGLSFFFKSFSTYLFVWCFKACTISFLLLLLFVLIYQ